MGNENNNIQTINENNKSKNTKKKLYINKNNFINFLIKVENGILLPNLNISNSISLNNICIPNKNNFLKNKEIKYIQSINDFTDKKLDENKKLNYDYSYEEKQYIQIINNIFNNNLKNKNNNYQNVINKNKYEIETKKNNISSIETTKREKNNYNNINGNYTERINNELRKLKIFKMGKIENDEIKNENILYDPNSPYSIRTYNTNPRSSNNYFNNTIENSHNHNNSFMTMKNNNIIYNNRMLITSPNSPKKNKSKINNENKNKSPKDNTNKKKSPKNNSRNKNIKKIDSKINSKYLVNNNNEIKNIKKYKSPDIKKRYFDKKKLEENRNIETSFLSEKEKEKQKERNKSMDFNMNNHNKKNRYRNLFDECDEKKISQNTIEYNNNKYTLIKKDLKENEKKNNIKNGIYKSPTTFKKKLINDKPIFQRKKIQEKKVDENVKNIEDNKEIKKKYNKNNEIDKFKNILSNKLDKNKKEKIEYINNIKQINNTENNNKLIDNNININNNNNIKKINKKKKPKKKIFELDELEEKNNTSEIKTNNNININNKYINDVYCSFAPNIEKEIKKEEGIYKSNDLERIIKENKNKKSIKKPNSDINTIFNYIENEYNVSEEENNNNNTNCDRSFSFRQKYTGSFGKEEKNINNINNENTKESEKDIKFSFKINSDINESEFNDINYF